MRLQMRTTAMQQKFAILLPSTKIRLLEKITNAIIIYNMSECVESDILYTDLAATHIERKKWII